MLAKSCLYQVLSSVCTCHFYFVVFRPLLACQFFCIIGKPCASPALLFGRDEGKCNCEVATFYKDTRTGYPRPAYIRVKPVLSSRSDFFVAIAAIDWPAVGRLERHFGVVPALGACGGKHLAWGPVAVTTASVPLCLPCLSA